MLTIQEQFEKMSEHLITQNARSVDKDNYCMYRGPNGLKCGVGCMIPDELYEASMEHKQVSLLLLEYPELCDLIDEYLAEAVQYIHDTCDPAFWPKQLKRLGRTINGGLKGSEFLAE